MHKIKKLIPLGVALLPFVAFAQTINDIILQIRGIVDTMIPLAMAIAFVVFLWGIVKFVTSAGDEEKRKEGKGYMIYGIIGLFVMVAVWGLIAIIASTFGVTTGGGGPVPTFTP